MGGCGCRHTPSCLLTPQLTFRALRGHRRHFARSYSPTAAVRVGHVRLVMPRSRRMPREDGTEKRSAIGQWALGARGRREGLLQPLERNPCTGKQRGHCLFVRTGRRRGSNLGDCVRRAGVEMRIACFIAEAG